MLLEACWFCCNIRSIAIGVQFASIYEAVKLGILGSNLALSVQPVQLARGFLHAMFLWFKCRSHKSCRWSAALPTSNVRNADAMTGREHSHNSQNSHWKRLKATKKETIEALPWSCWAHFCHLQTPQAVGHLTDHSDHWGPAGPCGALSANWYRLGLFCWHFEALSLLPWHALTIYQLELDNKLWQRNPWRHRNVRNQRILANHHGFTKSSCRRTALVWLWFHVEALWGEAALRTENLSKRWLHWHRRTLCTKENQWEPGSLQVSGHIWLKLSMPSTCLAICISINIYI